MPEYIERVAAIATVCKGCNKEFPNDPCEPAGCYIQQGLFKQPAADVAEVRHGHWKQADNTRRGHKFVCSVCNRVSYYPQPTRDRNWVKHCGYSHCPHCLAKMDGKGEGE